MKLKPNHTSTPIQRLSILLILFAALFVSSLILFAREAQAATLWSSNLHVQDLYRVNPPVDRGFRPAVGCISGSTSCSSHLTDRTFSIDSQTYTVTRVRLEPRYQLAIFSTSNEGRLVVLSSGTEYREFHHFDIRVSPQMPESAWSGLTLKVGSRGLSFDEANVKDYSDATRFAWFEPGFFWDPGDRVSLKIEDEPSEPLEPRFLAAKRGNGAVTLNWSAPRHTGGSAITRYEYRYKTTGEFPAAWTPVADGPDADDNAGNERSVTVSGLTNGVEYTFELRAANSAGARHAASVSERPNAPPTASDRTVTIDEDTTYQFLTSVWGFNDEDEGDSLQEVLLESDPPADAGALYTVLVGPSADPKLPIFDRIGLFFVPARNWNGDNYARFGFRVTDGKDQSDNVYTMTINVTPVNDPATGKPTISGARKAGHTLTASTAGIRDVDGFPDSFNYQWIRVDSDGRSNPVAISGATASTYTLMAADVGKRLRVRVRYIDRDGHSEDLTSDTTGVVQIQGTINVAPTASDATVVTDEDTDYTFRIADFGFSDANAGDVMTGVEFATLPAAGVIFLDGAALPAGATVLAGDIEDGKLMLRPAPNANGMNYASFTFKVSDGTAKSASANTITISVTPVNDPVTGKLRVVHSLNPPFRQKLEPSKAEIADADGMTKAEASNGFSYQWTVIEPGNTTFVSNNRLFLFWPSSWNPGTTISWKMTFTDDEGNTETVYSDQVYVVKPRGYQSSTQQEEPQSEAPYVLEPPSLSDPGDDNLWTPGEKVEISVTFNESMTVLAYDGVPSIGLYLSGADARSAEYDRGNSTNTLVFSYTLTEADGSHNSMVVPTNSLRLNDGVIQSRESGVAAVLTHDGKAVIGPPAQQQSDPRLTGGGLVEQESSNTPATGAPTITGTAQVGETLTADTSGIADADGLTNATFSYQWLADDTAITNASASTYTLTSSEQGKALKVKVTFTDDAGNEETLASDPTATVSERHDQPNQVTATATTGAIVLTWEAPDNFDGPDYHILRHRPELGEPEPLVYVDFTESTDTTFTDTDVEPGVLYVYRVRATINFLGELGEASDAVQIRMPVEDPSTPQDPNTLATGAPTITGTAQVGETLTADTSGIADADGLTNATFAYQWLADDADIGGATASTYTVVAGDVGITLKVRVNFTDDAGNDESVTSDATGAVAAAPSPLTAEASQVPASHDGNDSFTFELRFSEEPVDDFSYSTLRDHAFTVTGGEVINARRLNPPSNVGWEITVSPNGDDDVTVSLPVTTDCDSQGAVCTGDGRKLSNAIAITVPGPGEQQVTNSPATGAPTISGTAQVGETLTASTSGIADADGLTNATFSYRWLADDAEIAGATGSTYTLTASEQGKTIKVRVSFADDAGNEETLTSAATGAVATAPSPLTAEASQVPASHDGNDSFAFELRFSEEPVDDFSYRTLRDHAFTVTGGEVVNARRLQHGKNIGWEITVQPDGDGAVVIVLPVTTNCDSDGAVCTEDGRMLSGRLELTVSGPGG